jgi:hypothetical protein
MVIKRWIVVALLLLAEVWLVMTIVNATLGDKPDKVITCSAMGLLAGITGLIGVLLYRVVRPRGSS